MHIPVEVKIGYKDYSVEKVNDLNDGRNILYGQILYDEEKIKLKSDLTQNMLKCTLLHEVVHGIDEQNAINLTEEQVEKLGVGLYQFIRDNPEIFK